MYLMFSLINIAFCKYMRILKWLSVNTVRLQIIALSFYVRFTVSQLIWNQSHNKLINWCGSKIFKHCVFIFRLQHWFQRHCGWTQREDAEPLVENHLCISCEHPALCFIGHSRKSCDFFLFFFNTWKEFIDRLLSNNLWRWRWFWMRISWGRKLASWREPWEPNGGCCCWGPIGVFSPVLQRPEYHMNTAALRLPCWWTGSELCVTSTMWRWVCRRFSAHRRKKIFGGFFLVEVVLFVMISFCLVR